MPVTVRGVYREGTVVLLDRPPQLREGLVQVTLEPEPEPGPRFLRFGKYSRGEASTEEDFGIAEWRQGDLGDAP